MAVLPASDTVPGRWAISQTEITWDQWLACVAAHACRGGQDEHSWGRGSRPMINVNYDDALAYAHWLSKRTRKDYRLPSEALWSFAAHAGTTTAYPWGDEFSPERANTDETAIGATSAVGAFIGGHSPVGAEELSGNVWEWTRSLSGGREDLAAEPDKARVLRGGSWYLSAGLARCAYRSRDLPDGRLNNIGFRVVASPFFPLNSDSSGL